MEILIYISGALYNGMETPSSGEGRWGQQLAKVLAEKGHKVDCVVTHKPVSWGNTKPIENIRLLAQQPDMSKTYDVALYMPWEHVVGWPPHESCTKVPVNAEWCVHFSFSWAPSIASDHDCYKGNHALAYPYVQHGSSFPTSKIENPFLTFPLPIPIYKEFSPLCLSDRTLLSWTSKHVFHPDWPSDHHVIRLGNNILSAAKQLQTDYPSLVAAFVASEFLITSPTKNALDTGAYKTALSLRGSEQPLGLLRRDLLMSLLEKTRISLVVGGLLGSFGEAVAAGALPLTYDGFIHVEAARELGIALDQRTATKDDVYKVMDKLMDDSFYLEAITRFREEFKYYSYEASYEHFLGMMDVLGRVGA